MLVAESASWRQIVIGLRTDVNTAVSQFAANTQQRMLPTSAAGIASRVAHRWVVRAGYGYKAQLFLESIVSAIIGTLAAVSSGKANTSYSSLGLNFLIYSGLPLIRRGLIQNGFTERSTVAVTASLTTAADVTIFRESGLATILGIFAGNTIGEAGASVTDAAISGLVS